MVKSSTSKLVIMSLFLLVATALVPIQAHAIDASFVPQANVVLTCQSESSTDKKITEFKNNAPEGSQVKLFEGDSEGGGFSFGKELKVGDTVTNTPRLFWNIQGVLLGPWEVPTSVEGKCLTSSSAFKNEPSSEVKLLPYFIGAGVVLVLFGVFLAGKKFGKK